MKKIVRYIVVGIVVLLVSGFVIADTVNQEKQVLVDGDMEDTGVVTDIWTAGNSATLSKQTGGAEDGSQVLRIYKNGAYGQAMQNELTDGKTYRVTGWARGGDTGYPRINLHTVVVWTGDPANTWQYFDVTGTADGVSFVLYKIGDSDSYAEYDDLLVTELTPPIVNNEATVADFADGDMEEDGTDIPFIKKFDLTQAANITADSGVITGALTYSCAGAEFDGTNDYVTYTIPTTLFSTSPKLSIVIEFTPDFAYDDGAIHYLFDSTVGSRYLLEKDVNDTIYLYMGNIQIAGIAGGTYGAHWNAGGRNVLVISGTTGDTDVWLNGTQILIDDNTAWSPAAPTSLYVGALNDGSAKFDGEIHAVSIYSGLLDGTDATNLYNSVDTDDWPLSWADACLTKQLGAAESGSQVVRLAFDGTAAPYVGQEVLEVDTTYRVTGWARGDDTYYPRVVNNVGIWQGDPASTWQYFDETFTAGTTYFILKTNAGAAGHVEFDDILITEYTPPMANDYDQLLDDGDMELVGVAEWNAVSATLSKPAGAVEDGSLILRVTADAGAGDKTPQAAQDIIATDGTTYRVTGWARGDGTEFSRIWNGSWIWTSTDATNWQYFDETFTGAHLTILFGFSINGPAGTEYVEFDDVMVTEYE